MKDSKRNDITPGSAVVPTANSHVNMQKHKGWHNRGYLPHFDSPHVKQIITYRLYDSLPKAVIQNLYSELSSIPEKEKRKFIDTQLDFGHGSKHLAIPSIAKVVEDALKYFDDERYKLIAWVVMPNHVHVLIDTFENYPLSKVLHSWKSFTAHKANDMLKRKGAFWQEEYWDRYVRNEEHYLKAIDYIYMNPVKAGLVCRPEDWRFSSARKPSGQPRSQEPSRRPRSQE